MSRNNMYNYPQQYAFAFSGSCTQLSFGGYSSAGEEWCFDQSYASAGSRTAGGKHQKDQRALERNVAKMRKEWTKVKEEMGHLKQHGKHLSEALTQTDQKVAMMLLELEQADEYMRNLMAQSDD